MDEAEIKKLLRPQAESVTRGWRCPDENQLAEYIDGGLDTSTRQTLESHIAGCSFCLSQVAFLSEAADWHDDVEVPAPLVSQARYLIRPKPKGVLNWGWRWAVAGAAVACLILFVLVVVLQLQKREMNSSPDRLLAEKIEPQSAPSPRILLPLPSPNLERSSPVSSPKRNPAPANGVRSKSVEETGPRLMEPLEGAAFRREDLQVRWQPVSDALFYEVRVMTAAGDVVFVEQTENTSLKPGTRALLTPGAKYFVVVSAHLHQGKTDKSGLVSFRIIGQ